MMDDNKTHKLKNTLLLFLLFLKIGLFTFGGGYAMISLIRREFVDKRKWITSTEFMDMIAISESTPGPLAINSATYVGFKIGGFVGALCATIGVVIPSFVIIYIISLFLERFLALKVVAAAFKGIQIAVAFLILTAGIRLFKEMEKKPLTLIMAGAVFIIMIVLDIFALSFSSVYLILIGAAIGLFTYLICHACERRKGIKCSMSQDVPDGENAKELLSANENQEMLKESDEQATAGTEDLQEKTSQEDSDASLLAQEKSSLSEEEKNHKSSDEKEDR